eukprot:PhM_4_TR17022/c0_g1_i1/m.40016
MRDLRAVIAVLVVLSVCFALATTMDWAKHVAMTVPSAATTFTAKPTPIRRLTTKANNKDNTYLTSAEQVQALYDDALRPSRFPIARKDWRGAELTDVWFDRLGRDDRRGGVFSIVSADRKNNNNSVLVFDVDPPGSEITKPRKWLEVVRRKNRSDDDGTARRRLRVPSGAVLLPMGNCMMNYHHGWVDTFLPYFHRVWAASSGTLTSSSMPLAMIIPLGKNKWGLRNRSCPQLNRHPYSLQNKLSWMLHKSLDSAGLREKLWPGVPVLEHYEYAPQERDPREHHLSLDRLLLGGNYSCHESFLTSAWVFPFYTTHNAACHDMLMAARTFVMESWGLPPGSERLSVPPEEIKCPNIVLVSRKGATNGRRVDNMDELATEIPQRVLQHGCGTSRVVFLEQYSFVDQIRLMLNTTILVAPRGAGSINYLYLRHGAAFVSLSSINYNIPASRELDNLPWHPMSTMTRHIYTQFGLCDVTKCIGKKQFGNLCNMQCDVGTTVVPAIEAVLSRMSGDGPGPEALHVPKFVRSNGGTGKRNHYFYVKT